MHRSIFIALLSLQVLSKLQKTSLDDSKEAGGTTDEKKESTSSDTEEGEIKESSKGDDEVIFMYSKLDMNTGLPVWSRKDYVDIKFKVPSQVWVAGPPDR